MDNRIPKIIKDFIRSNPKVTEIDFLSFNDWLSLKENKSEDWLIVGRNQKTQYADYYTISCLIEANEDSLKDFLSNVHWYINSEFGIPGKYQKPDEGEKYEDGLYAELNNVIYYPFIFRRHYSGYVKGHFQIIEHFLLYYNAFWVEEKKEYQAINEDGEISTIAKYNKSEDNELFEVDIHFLKDYLAVKGCFLARFHDHRRRSTKDISDFLKSKGETYKLSNSDFYYELDLRVDIQYDDVKSTSRLLGKDIIQPYAFPKTHEWSEYNEQKEYIDFIIGRDTHGKEIKHNCNPDKLSSYFTDQSTTHYLTAVYFKREVLQKYYSEPAKYVVTEFSINYLDFWAIPIDTTKENLVQVYLGDLGRDLPYNEQLHWRQFNVVPKGKISNHRFKSDFLNEFASPQVEDAPIFHFKQEFETLQKEFKKYSGEVLFKELNKHDNHLYSTLHIPFTEEWKEIDEQLLALAKITTDSFNNKILVQLVGKRINDVGTNGKPIKGLLALFYESLIKLFPDEANRNSIIEPFNMVQSLRSVSVAHRKSDEFDKALLKYGLSELSNEQKIKKLVIELIKSFKAIIHQLTKEGDNTS